MKSLLFKNKSEIIKPQANKLIETKMNANNNNQTPCANAFADNAPNCVGIVAVGNEHGLCSACETKRRQDALDEIFARHNMSAVAVGGGRMECGIRVIECERCGQIKPSISSDPTHRVCGDCESDACQ